MMVTANTPYSDTYKNIPANYRFQWKQLTNRELTLTDEEIFEVWKESFDWEWLNEEGEEAPEHKGGNQDNWVRQRMSEILDEREAFKS